MINQTSLDNLCEELNELTDSNNHTEAYIKVCSYFNLVTLCDKFRLVLSLQSLDGHLNHYLNQYRYQLYELMLNDIQRKHGDYVHNKIYGCL